MRARGRHSCRRCRETGTRLRGDSRGTQDSVRRCPLGSPRLTSIPLRTMKLSGAAGLVSLAGTSAFHPDRSRPLNNRITRSGTTACTSGGGVCAEDPSADCVSRHAGTLRIRSNARAETNTIVLYYDRVTGWIAHTRFVWRPVNASRRAASARRPGCPQCPRRPRSACSPGPRPRRAARGTG